MSWFKVDDSFYDHPKVTGLDMAARGLWVTAGAYCGRHDTDGVISDKQIKMLGGTRKQAEKLVAADLWRVVESVEGDAPSARGYAFVDWLDYQPSRAETKSRRQKDADRKRAARAAKGADQQRSATVRTDVHADVRARSALPDPTRPDPAPVVGAKEGKGTFRDAREQPRCQRHRGDPSPPPCHACADARREVPTPTPPPVAEVLGDLGSGSTPQVRRDAVESARRTLTDRKPA